MIIVKTVKVNDEKKKRLSGEETVTYRERHIAPVDGSIAAQKFASCHLKPRNMSGGLATPEKTGL